MFTKQNTPAILTIFALFLTMGFIFWHGDTQIKKAGNIESTVIAWKGLNGNNLAIFIQNLENKKNNYQIDFLLDNKIVDNQKIEIRPKQKITIKPTEKVLAKIKNSPLSSSKQNSEILYQIKISWDKNSEILGKWIKVKK